MSEYTQLYQQYTSLKLFMRMQRSMLAPDKYLELKKQERELIKKLNAAIT